MLAASTIGKREANRKKNNKKRKKRKKVHRKKRRRWRRKSEEEKQNGIEGGEKGQNLGANERPLIFRPQKLSALPQSSPVTHQSRLLFHSDRCSSVYKNVSKHKEAFPAVWQRTSS